MGAKAQRRARKKQNKIEGRRPKIHLLDVISNTDTVLVIRRYPGVVKVLGYEEES